MVTLLETHSPSSPEVAAALDELHKYYPSPHSEVVGEEVWGRAKLSISTHLKSDIADAIANIERTGRKIGKDDKRWLKRILTHGCGWSATDSHHLNDSWVLFLRALSGRDDLVPILDSLVWPEEIARFPHGCYPYEPSFFLLAAPETYYVFILEGLGLYKAGNSLEEVYTGLKQCRYKSEDEGDWEAEEWHDSCLDERDYFPVYGDNRKSDFTFNLLWPLRKFPTGEGKVA